MGETLRFWLIILKELWQTVRTDVDVFLMLVAGLLLGGRRGLGKALLFYIAVRRGDQVAAAYATKLDQIFLLMSRRTTTTTHHYD